MKNPLFILSFICFTLPFIQAAKYAILVSGGQGFDNYRHEANTFRLYQALIKNGFKADNIITMASDDSAYHPLNPFPGKIFNKPSTGSGQDVYEGVKIDYKGDEVTPENFLNILTGGDYFGPLGNSIHQRKIFKTTKEDNIFVYFTDHGLPGFLSFPNDKKIYADELNAAIKYMHQKKAYKEMVIYIEACNSASMFEDLLPNNLNVYAVTSANANENAWSAYCGANAIVNGKEIGTCLGDAFSGTLIDHISSFNSNIETLLNQFVHLKVGTTRSHVMRFGDFSIFRKTFGNFQADIPPNDSKGNNLLSHEELEKQKAVQVGPMAIINEDHIVDSRLVKLHYLERRHVVHKNNETFNALNQEKQSIERFDRIFSRISSDLKLNVELDIKGIDFACYKPRIETFENICGRFSEYGFKYVKYIHFSCSQNVSQVDYEKALLKYCVGEIDKVLS